MIRVLITCGATWTPIDDVRVISNISSGEMGHLIAEAFRKQKAEVTVIEGPVTHALTDKKVKVIKYRFFDELANVLKKELLKKYDIIIHAAAVSDFKVVGASGKKIASDRNVTLRLRIIITSNMGIPRLIFNFLNRMQGLRYDIQET